MGEDQPPTPVELSHYRSRRVQQYTDVDQQIANWDFPRRYAWRPLNEGDWFADLEEPEPTDNDALVYEVNDETPPLFELEYQVPLEGGDYIIAFAWVHALGDAFGASYYVAAIHRRGESFTCASAPEQESVPYATVGEAMDVAEARLTRRLTQLAHVGLL
jgi:hypothetical protein